MHSFVIAYLFSAASQPASGDSQYFFAAGDMSDALQESNTYLGARDAHAALPLVRCRRVHE
jgi:hypothetical protein